MIFFFKPKVIHLDCFTKQSDVYEFFPIDYSHKFYPDWWKSLPKVIPMMQPQGLSTMKLCTGFNNFYANGITIPLWSDFLINIRGKQTSWKFSDQNTEMMSHLFIQMNNYLNGDEYFHYKIFSPWSFKCKEDVNFMWVQSTWSFNKPEEIIIPPAIIDYKYQIGTNINFFGKYVAENTKKDILIEAGQPMVNIIPLSERKLKFHNHLIGQDEYNKIVMPYKIQSKFHSLYNNRKKFLDKKESKCPFGF